jgi:hypothetical protein
MPPSTKRSIYFFAGLLVIVLVYSLYNIYLLDAWFFEVTSRAVRHVIRFASIIIVFGIGLWVFRKWGPPDWLVTIWLIFYGTGLLILVLLGIFDGWIHSFGQSFRDMTVTFHEFLISPAAYVIVGIIGRAARR